MCILGAQNHAPRRWISRLACRENPNTIKIHLVGPIYVGSLCGSESESCWPFPEPDMYIFYAVYG